MKLRAIACEIFYRELCAAASRSVNQVDLAFMPKRLHDIGAKAMSERLQAAIDETDPEIYDAIVLGYGLCNYGVIGLHSSRLPMAIARSHDCIGLFMGSTERYLRYFHSKPGTYFKTSGWIERGEEGDWSQLSIRGIDSSFEEFKARYGEDNARYLSEALGGLTAHYTNCAYIRMGVEPDERFELKAGEEAMNKGWSFETLEGDLSWLQRLLDGEWNHNDILTLQPGETIAADYGEAIIQIEGPYETA